ncbi:MAG: hypothetical protein JNL21_14610 [Myxococcales bacterium]|nr:hypothetical protein [Myxococcales bacterium]
MSFPRTKALHLGLYDEPLTRELEVRLEGLGPDRVEWEQLDEHHAPLALSRLLHPRVVRALASLDGEERGLKQLELVNKLLALLQAEAPRGGTAPMHATAKARMKFICLVSVASRGFPTIAPTRFRTVASAS